MVEGDKSDSVDFKWDKKRGVGGKKKEIQFYQSFFWDGVHYSLYDCVYLYEEGEPEPHVGKVIKIWETPDKTKKVKVLWFFRPNEIANYLEGEVVPENELFLATGEGVGLADVNPLEAIAGKCNIVCTSRDERNTQPSNEEIQMADFVFYRTFHVRNYKISDKIDEKICGVEAKFIFNRTGSLDVEGANEGEKKEGGTLANAKSMICPTSDLLENIRDKQKNASFGDASHKEEMNLENPKIEEKGVVSLDNASSKNKLSLDILVNKASQALDMACPISKDEVGDGVDKDKNVIKPKPLRDTGDESRPSKRPKLNALDETSKEKEYNIKMTGLATDDKADVSMRNISLKEGKLKPKQTNGSLEREKGRLSMKPNEKKKLSNEKSLKKPPKGPSLEGDTSNYQATQVARHSEVDNNKWFKELPWEDKIESAHRQGTLVLLRNFDPTCTSLEVEDIVRRAFNEVCSAKMIQHTSISSPHCGQAFVVFKTKDAARKAIQRLEEGCLLLSNGRPLLGSIGNPCFPGKQSTFNGHILLSRLPLNREMKEAVSTSHCSQPNTIEYEMALDWCLLQKRADCFWRKLYQNQEEELKRAKGSLKSK